MRVTGLFNIFKGSNNKNDNGKKNTNNNSNKGNKQNTVNKGTKQNNVNKGNNKEGVKGGFKGNKGSVTSQSKGSYSRGSWIYY